MTNKILTSSLSNGIILLGVPAFVIPLFLLDTTLDPALTPRFTMLAVALVFAIVFIYRDFYAIATNGDYLTRTITLPLLVYLFCIILSLTRAINLSEGIFEVLKTLLFLIVLLVATVILRMHQRNLPVLAKGISILAVIISVIGISQYYEFGFVWIPGAADAQPYSTFTNKNLFSSFLFLTIPFIVFGYYTFTSRWSSLTAISIAVTVYAILIAQTRAVWVASVFSFAVVAVAGALYILKKRFRIHPQDLPMYKARTLRLCAMLIVVITLNVFQPTIFRSPVTSSITTIEKAASIFDKDNSSRMERITLWKKTLHMIGEHPLLGVGAGNWKIVLPKYGLGGTRMEMGTVHFLQPHNDFLWVTSEIGLVGVIAYAAIFLLGIYYCVRIINKSDKTQDQILAIAMAFGIIGYLTISFFDFPKERIEHLVYVAFILSTVLATYDRLFPAQIKLPKRVVQGLGGIIVLVLFSSVVVGLIRMQAEMHTRKALVARGASDWDGVIREIDEASSSFATLDPMVTPLSWYRGVANFSKNNTAIAFEDFKSAYAIHPYHIHVLNNLATCYEMSGDHSTAIEFYNKALAISPRFEESLLNLTAVYFNLGKYEEAYQTILKCGDSKNPKATLFLAAVKAKLTD